MLRPYRRACFTAASLITLAFASAALPRKTAAQDADPRPQRPDTSMRFPNTIAGEFTPSAGFDIVKTSFGSLNISVYGLFRYLNQVPGDQTFRDHLGNLDTINTSNYLNWHRTLVWLTGFFYDPRFRYNITLWSLPTTQQTLLFGNLQYTAAKQLTLGIGIAPSTTARSMNGSWPFWAGSDRTMAEEFFRGGFSSGLFATGEILPRLAYTLTMNNNISELGVPQSADTRNMLFGGQLRWRPTTGEFGPRGGFGDFEYHTHVATQFGFNGSQSREGRYAPIADPPLNTQIKLSDGINPFAVNALADSVTVSTLSYREVATDAGVKYRGFSFQGEYYWRTLSDFVANGPLPLTSIFDRGFMAQAGYMAIPQTLNVYALGGYVHDQFRRYPWEAGGGVGYYPSHTRSWRLDVRATHINQCPASSSFGYYLAGVTGTIISVGTDILF
ncbi:MAG TPA: hypothetical protein VGQ44_22230 [Gemmatimonadaceae bacterium]|nr:hypothetical protein [Gemmatimonadaceae bacterium]